MMHPFGFVGQAGGRLLARALVLMVALAGRAESGPDTPEVEEMPSTAGSLANLSLEELAEVKVDIVQGASRHDQKTTEAPASVSIVTADDIRKNGHRTMADILGRVRGIYISYDRGYHYLGSRGFNRPGDFGGRFLLMIDGHRLNDGIYDSAALGSDFPLDIDLIEKVEVIRGPGSSLYGNNAFFGIINVVTRRGAAIGGAELAGSYGSFDAWTGRATYGGRLANGIEFAVSATLAESQGDEALEFPEYVARNLDGGWNGNVFASVSYADLTLQGGFSRRQKYWPAAGFGTVPGSEDPRLSMVDERAWVGLRFQREVGDEWQLMIRPYFDHYQFNAVYPYDYDEDASTIPTINRDLTMATSAGLEFSVGRVLWEKHRVVVGGEWRRDIELRVRNWDSSPRVDYLDTESSADILGAFLQDEWNIRSDLILNAGLRYDYYSAFGDTLNPRTGLIYAPWEMSTFKLLYGQAFRAPNAYERNYVGTLGRDNPNLQPETIQSFEWVWEQRLGRSWSTSLGLFWSEVDDLIDKEIDPGSDPVSSDDDRFFYDNSHAATIRGVEVEADGMIAGRLRALASYTLAYAEDRSTGAVLENSPRHVGKLNLSVPVWREKVFAGMELQTMSERLTASGDGSDPFAVLNLTLYSRELAPGLEVSASLYNVLDQTYSHVVSPDFTYRGPISGDPIVLGQVEQDGRTFRIKLIYRF